MLRNSLFWVITQLVVAISYRRFGATYLSHPNGACTHTGFLPESDPVPVVGFFTRTGITAAGGHLEFERCTTKMFVHRNRSATCLCSYILGENTKNAKDNTGYVNF